MFEVSDDSPGWHLWHVGISSGGDRGLGEDAALPLRLGRTLST